MDRAVEKVSAPLPSTDAAPSAWIIAAVALGMIASIALLPTVRSDTSVSTTPQQPVAKQIANSHGAGVDVSIDQGDAAITEHNLRARIEHDPNNDVLRRELIDLIGDRTPKRDSEAYRIARSQLPAHFGEHETRRFLVISDADSNWTLLQAERLERAHHQFMRFAEQLGLNPLPLRHKLVCVLFQNQQDYLEFAATHDGVNARWIGGYYAPSHDRIVFYNVESGASVNQARHQIGAMKDEIDSLRQRAAEAHRAGDRRLVTQIDEHLRRYERHLREQRERLASFTADTIIATTLHEAVHQLAFHSLIQHPHVPYPLWISEGLATVFETNRPNQAFGPAYEHVARRETFSTLLRDNRLIPLRELITVTDRDALGKEPVAAIYHQSYALVIWMHRFRRDELSEYLRLMRGTSPRPLSNGEHIGLFESTFGNIDRLEHAWLRHEHASLR